MSFLPFLTERRNLGQSRLRLLLARQIEHELSQTVLLHRGEALQQWPIEDVRGTIGGLECLHAVRELLLGAAEARHHRRHAVSTQQVGQERRRQGIQVRDRLAIRLQRLDHNPKRLERSVGELPAGHIIFLIR